MENQAAAPQPRRLQITFPADPHAPNLPVLYVNAMQVLLGSNEIYVTLGTVKPLQVQTLEDFEALDQLPAEPIFRFAVAPQVFKDFADLMTAQYELLVRHPGTGDRAKQAKGDAANAS